jgi:hypothetical protein
MEERRGACRVVVERPREGDHLEDLGVDSKVTLKCIFQNGIGRYGLDS